MAIDLPSGKIVTDADVTRVVNFFTANSANPCVGPLVSAFLCNVSNGMTPATEQAVLTARNWWHGALFGINNQIIGS